MESPAVRELASAEVMTTRGPSTMAVFDASLEVTVVSFPGFASGRRLVRIHSQCVTSELFGSLHCDCREQLDQALDFLADSGGVLIYEPTEGRGIGLAAKLRAYALQARGLDTFAANRHLGLPEDARDFAAAAAVVRHLGLRKVELLSNNPRKVEALHAVGIDVIPRSLFGPLRPENRAYVACKASHAGHGLHPLLAAEAC